MTEGEKGLRPVEQTSTPGGNASLAPPDRPNFLEEKSGFVSEFTQCLNVAN